MSGSDIKEVLELYYSVVKQATNNIANGKNIEGNKAVIVAYGTSILELEALLEKEENPIQLK